jgi:hypothetical protein
MLQILGIKNLGKYSNTTINTLSFIFVTHQAVLVLLI